MKEYSFRLIHDDNRVWYFKKSFPSAYLADRFSTKAISMWFSGTINYRIVFLPD